MGTFIWAHRGASGYFPENTIPSFQGAIDMKADGIELDVHASFDGQIVVSHDDTLKRCGGGDVSIHSVTYEEIKKHPVPAKYADKYPDVICPLLTDVFELMRPHNMIINIEIKPGWKFDNIKQLVNLVHDTNMQEKVMYSSFDHTALYMVRTLDKKCRLGALHGGYVNEIARMASLLGFTELHPHMKHCSNEIYMEEARKYNLRVNPYAVGLKDDIQRLARIGCHALILDRPDTAREALESMK